jgi:hypothetical protein
MNEPSLNDPQLLSLEARLAAMAPQESPARQQELLYRCAFAAGQSSARTAVRRWQAAAVALAVLLIGASIPLANHQLAVAKRDPKPAPPQRVAPPQPPMLAQQEIPPTVREPVHLELDAWQVASSPSTSLAIDLAQFQQVDPELRSLAAGALARSVLQQ